MTDAPDPLAVPLDAHASASLLARWVVVERALFERTGAVAGAAQDDELAVVLGAESRHHAWRAEQLLALLPLLADRGPEAWVASATAELAGLLEALGEVVDPAAVLAMVHRLVQPTLVTAWRERSAGSLPATDAEVHRVLRVVLLDAELDAARAAPVLARLDPTPPASPPAIELLASIALVHGSGPAEP